VMSKWTMVIPQNENVQSAAFLPYPLEVKVLSLCRAPHVTNFPLSHPLRGARLRTGASYQGVCAPSKIRERLTEDVGRARTAISTGSVDLSSAEDAVGQMIGGKGQCTFDQLPESSC